MPRHQKHPYPRLCTAALTADSWRMLAWGAGGETHGGVGGGLRGEGGDKRLGWEESAAAGMSIMQRMLMGMATERRTRVIPCFLEPEH